ncbi:MAG: hypothetical protein ACREEE_04320 [Dongiaceae bacterium]
MPVDASVSADELGTRFLLFPQAPSLSGYGEPERVWVSPPAGTIGPGPSDDRMYVVDPIEKPDHYEYPYMPPFHGAANPPVEPGPSGHFDHLEPASRAFACAHLYGSLCRVLDIWESYLGRRIEWFFKDGYERLELVPMLDWHNAQSGYGYMEFGFMRTEAGDMVPHALNFDVIAHEMGHTIMFSEMGVPAPEGRNSQFHGFHEACADLTALISALHFDSVSDRLLRGTHGNLYTLNEINRIAEISDHKQIRIAGNSRTMSEVTDEVHDLSRPFTGAVFDILVDIYLDQLRERGLIDDPVALAAHGVEAGEGVADRIQAAFDEAYRTRHFAFKSALFSARDLVGRRLAHVWTVLSPDDLSYADAATAFLDADRKLGQGRYERAIVESFAWREII